MTTYYVGCVEVERPDNYGIWFPDILGCISAADSFPEIMAMGEEALNGHVGVMRRDGDPIPKPRSVEEIKADPQFSDWVKGMFFVQIPLYDVQAVAVE